MRVADFFCGGGGFSEGFRQAGFEIVFAVDKWAPAVNTYKGNKPGANVIQDDVIRISNLPDDEFEALVPDSEVIIGSPPCQSFSHSNKSGNADKELGIKLIEAYLKIVARKKFKQGSVLRYWVLENVPAVKDYIKDEYTAADFGLDGDFVLRPKDGASGKYNAKYYGAPTNRERYLCGEFPRPVATKTDNNITTLRQVLDSLGDPLRADNGPITDINYPDFTLEAQQVTDQHYIYELAAFECKTAKRLKQDKGYMGKMSFPENLDKPARTVMATMTASAREAMILGYGEGRYRLPTVREAACMMSFPITSCNLDGKCVIVAKDTTKTKSSRRTLPLVPYFHEKLLAVKAQQERNQKLCGRSYNREFLEYICVDDIGDRFKPNYITSQFPKLLERNGFRKIRFHDLRHSCASLLLASGVPMKHIQEWLGHSDFSTTANIYAHLDYSSKLTSASAMESNFHLGV